MKGKRKTKIPLAAIGLVTFLALAVEGLSATDRIQGFILPAPSAVILALYTHFDEIFPHMIETIWVCTAGFVLSIAAALITAIVMDGIKVIKDAVYPLIIASQTIPIMVITPVIILLMGYGLAPRLLVVVLVCFFPIVISMFDGLQNVDPDMLLLMKSLKANRWQILKHVKFPASMPSFFSGIRISSTYCVMATVIAEWQGSNEGLGIYLMRVRRSYLYDRMFASILLIVVISLIFFLLAQLAEKKIIKWKRTK